MAVMRGVLVLAGALLLCQPASAEELQQSTEAGSASGGEPYCDDAAAWERSRTCRRFAAERDAGDDASALMQQQVARRVTAEAKQQKLEVNLSAQERQGEKLPDLGHELREATDLVAGLPGFDHIKRMAEKAADALENAAAGVLVTLGRTLNRTLATLTEQAGRFHTEVLQTEENITSGVATVLGRLFNVSVEDVPVGQQFEAVANRSLIAAVAIWKAVDTSAEVAILGLTRGLDAAGFRDTAEHFNSSLRGALSYSASFAQRLEKVQVLLANSTDTAGDESAEMLLQLPFIERVLRELNETMRDAREELFVFTPAFTGAFKGLEEAVVNASKATLDPEAVAKVQATFADTRRQAEALADTLAGSASTLLDSVDGGAAAATPLALRSAAVTASGLPCLALSLVTIASLLPAATSM